MDHVICLMFVIQNHIDICTGFFLVDFQLVREVQKLIVFCIKKSVCRQDVCAFRCHVLPFMFVLENIAHLSRHNILSLFCFFDIFLVAQCHRLENWNTV